MACEVITKGGGSGFGDRQSASRNDQGRRAELGNIGAHHELGTVLNLKDSAAKNNLYSRTAALGFEQVRNVPGGAIAEELSESFLVVGDAMPFDQGDEVLRGITGQRRFCEVRIPR